MSFRTLLSGLGLTATVNFSRQFALLVILSATATAADLAVLRNGYTIRHETREEIGTLTRLYISADKSSFVDVPTADVEHFEKCGSPIASVLRTLTPHDGQPARFRDYFLVQHPFRPHNQILSPDQPRPSALSALRKASVDLSERRGLDSRIKLA